MGRRDEILDILTHKFQEEGFSMDLTLSQIAEKLDIGKSTIYEYFKSKDEIYKEAILRIIQSHINETLSSFDVEGDFETSFKFVMNRLLTIAAQSRMMMEVFTRNFVDKLPSGFKEELKVTMENTRDIIQDRFLVIFSKGIQEGILTGAQDQIKQEVVSSLVVGAIVRYSDQASNVDINEFISEIYKYVVLISNK